MLRFGQALVLAAGVASLSLGGCNAVLGIDEAHDRDTGTVASKLEIPIAKCDAPMPAGCSTCLEMNCGNFRKSCLASHDCREALNDYRSCLGAGCNNNSCLDALTMGPAAQLAGCMQGDECKSACAPLSPLAEMCDLYCACMEAPLPASAGVPAGNTCETVDGVSLKDWVAGDTGGCKARCEQMNDLPSVHCRWSHCELAQSGEVAGHCGHAISEGNCPLHVQVNAACKDRKITGWGCQRDDECCGHCDKTTNFCAD